MPCLVLTGHPCSGKSTFARILRDRALRKYATPPWNIRRVVLIQDEDFFSALLSENPKAACYQDSQAEKKTRAALKSAFDRVLSSSSEQADNNISHPKKSTLVIVDSLNYIKGFRYELHCLSKASNEKHGTVWILNDVESCKEWNQQRRTPTTTTANDPVVPPNNNSYYYTDEQMDALILRYEPPDARNRWDQPLYRVDMRPFDAVERNVPSAARDALQRSVYNMHKLSDVMEQQPDSNNCTPQPEQQPKVKKSVFKKRSADHTPGTVPPTIASPAAVDVAVRQNEPGLPSSTTQSASLIMKDTPHVPSLEERADEILDSFLLNVRPLQEGRSTRHQAATDANVLHNVDTITQRICSSIHTTAQNHNNNNHKSTTSAIGHKLSLLLQSGETLYLEDSFRRIPQSELKRLRQQYIQWIQTHPPEDSTERGISESFLAYLAVQR